MLKPKDLCIPFNWAERRPCIFDSFLCVPNHYFEHDQFSMPQWSEIFENEQPIHLEYCSGNGQWIIEQASKHPKINWIGVEKRIERVKKIWAKGQNRGLKNLLTVFGEASTFTKYYLKEHSISQIYVNFPDPWPKKKHEKNRLIQVPFVKEMGRISKKKEG